MLLGCTLLVLKSKEWELINRGITVIMRQSRHCNDKRRAPLADFRANMIRYDVCASSWFTSGAPSRSNSSMFECLGVRENENEGPEKGENQMRGCVHVL